MYLTLKQLRALDRRLLKEFRRRKHLTLVVDDVVHQYRVSPVTRPWWRTHHLKDEDTFNLVPRVRHARWEMVRLNSPYRSDHYEYVEGRPTVWTHLGRTRGEALRILVRSLFLRGVKVVQVLRTDGRVQDVFRA